MASARIAKATVALERLDSQAVTLERLAVLEEKTLRLVGAGVSYEAIMAKRDEMNSLSDVGVQHDFNDALLRLYDETFGSTTERGGDDEPST